ncbi:DUF3093 family protein [Amycolatopsis cihanbeyliensis]|uniref:DUF3093 family protein n=1 Tax=Amycolatopsis cihanbeyliensis TaxID=1128664 RepID=A0A542DJR3_AMYCI|nr:DUF3093 family protein [Amycolatopsis cihanbeyliensis]TQJ03342.1 DUF3093 family protein [Amycolatopsis cihanbeyliensis]
MTEPAAETTIYHEPGAGGAPLLWGPAFALAGYLAELSLGGPTHIFAWVLVGVVLLLLSAAWVYARRRFLLVRVTPSMLWQGRETLPVARIAELAEIDAPLGTRVLGGGWTVPRKYTEVPVRLDDGSLALAWARDGERLRSALHEARKAG